MLNKIFYMWKLIKGILGVSVISKRHAVANNQHLSDFDPSKPSNYLWYIDANNLYGKFIVLKIILLYKCILQYYYSVIY